MDTTDPEDHKLPVKWEWSPWKPTRRDFAVDAEFFEDGDIQCGLASKHPLDDTCIFDDEVELDDQMLDSLHRNAAFCCHVATCKKMFNSVASYEMHYSTMHRNVCKECHRHFPSHHLLDIHLQEWHDPMFQLLVAKQSMYRCLVETCSCKFATVKERKDHMIKVHKYPSNFRFDRALKKPQKQSGSKVMSSTPPGEQMETEAGSTQDVEPQSSSQTVKRQFVYSVPKTICFGQGAQRGFQRPPQGKKKGRRKKHWHEQSSEGMDTTVNIEEVKLSDLAQALEPT